MGKLIDQLEARKLLVSDGAWGTFLHAKGLRSGECPESWNLDRPDDVRDIPAAYFEAGADMVLTNSFGGSPFKLQHYGLAEKTYEINKAAAEISRQAAGPDKLVLGSVGPTGVILMMGDVSPDALYEGFVQQVTGLAAGGVDAICIETMSALDEAEQALLAVRRNTDLDVVCTFTFEQTVDGDFRTMMGVSPEDMVEAFKSYHIDVIGTNCGNGMKQMLGIVERFKTAIPGTPVLVHANAGKPVIGDDGKTHFPESPEQTASFVRDIVKAGASIIGGCCGTTPEHIREIRKIVDTLV